MTSTKPQVKALTPAEKDEILTKFQELILTVDDLIAKTHEYHVKEADAYNLYKQDLASDRGPGCRDRSFGHDRDVAKGRWLKFYLRKQSAGKALIKLSDEAGVKAADLIAAISTVRQTEFSTQDEFTCTAKLLLATWHPISWAVSPALAKISTAKERPELLEMGIAQ